MYKQILSVLITLLFIPVICNAGDIPIIWYNFNAQAPWYECPTEPFPPQATVVTAFDQEYHYYGPENRRTAYNTVNFPDTGPWSQIGLWIYLECPASTLCDHWDRLGSFQLVLNPDDAPENWEYLEIMRYITPYRRGMCQYVDVTALEPLLRGQQTLQSFISTWVGPGHDQGEGWRITAKFVFYPGPSGGADQVINIWGRRTIIVGYIEPDRNVDSQINPVTFYIPRDTRKVVARLITTGHSFGNTYNCAEFCKMRQDLYVNGTLFSVTPWRSDCEFNPVSPQAGTWKYDRNGWCPGAVCVGDKFDVTSELVLGGYNTIDFDIRMADGTEYHNISPASWDPNEEISLQLYVYTNTPLVPILPGIWLIFIFATSLLIYFLSSIKLS